MTRLFLLLLATLFVSVAFAQQKTELQVTDSIAIHAKWIATDKMQHLYVIKNDHTIHKYDAQGQLLYQFNENSLGAISSIDVQNPFYILVYYNDYTTVIILDRTLSEVRRQDLADLDIYQVQAIGMASDNNIWLFDNATYTLKKISAQNEVLLQSTDLSLLTGNIPNPIQLIEYENMVYLNSPEDGILVFDQYATYAKTIELRELEHIQLYEGQLFYMFQHQLYTYHLLSFQIKPIILPFLTKKIKQVSIAQSRLYLLLEEQIQLVETKKVKK